MARKTWGIVCDNDECRKFIAYANEDGIKECVIVAPAAFRMHGDSITREYCSKDCAMKHKAKSEARGE